MKHNHRSYGIAAAAVLVLMGATATEASTFTALSQSRSIAATAQVTLFSLDPDVATLSDSLTGGAQTAVVDFGAFSASFGLGALSISDPVLGSARGNGRAAQTSSFSADRISFDGTADVNMEGEPIFGNADVSGTGSASSRLSFGFSLAQATSIQLTMSSNVTPSRSSYNFALLDGGGQSVWNQTSIFDVNGNETRDFVVTLNLGAGTYALNTALGASSFVDNGSSGAGRAVASFTLAAAPVPEPGATLLFTAGLTLVGSCARRRRATPACPRR